MDAGALLCAKPISRVQSLGSRQWSARGEWHHRLVELRPRRSLAGFSFTDQKYYRIDDKESMSPITNLSSQGLTLSSGVQGNKSNAGSGHASTPAVTPPPQAVEPSPASNSVTDSMELSQFAVLLSGLRALHQSDPNAFTALLSEIGATLSYAAQAASSQGDANSFTVAQMEQDLGEASAGLKP